MPTEETLLTLRQAAAEAQFSLFDFGRPVSDTGHWVEHFATTGNVLVRTVWLDTAGEDAKGTVIVRFAVRFDPRTADIAGVSAASPTSSELLAELGAAAVSDDGVRLEEAFVQFPAGTDLMQIWAWLEAREPGFSIYRALFPSSCQ